MIMLVRKKVAYHGKRVKDNLTGDNLVDFYLSIRFST
jgi:hypothetical protein